MGLKIRHAVPGDETAVVGLLRELAEASDYPTPIDEHYVRHFLAAPDAGVLLAEDGRTAVGLLSYVTVPGLFHAADSGIIEALVVTEGRRGEGIGRRLLDVAVRLLRDAGCAEISIGADAENERVQRLYVEAGFTEASVLRERHFED
jgi:ribosomal protein S18 acetylase RimI-like enzyme